LKQTFRSHIVQRSLCHRILI